MPRKSKTAGASKVKRVLRSKEAIKGLMQQIATARSSGSTLTEALKQANVPYNTYSQWVKKSGSAVARTPVKAGRVLRSGKTESEIRKLLNDVVALRAGGTTRTQALQQLGVLSTTYDYWTRKYGRPASATPGKESGTKRKGKSEEEVRKLLAEIAALRKSGKTKTQALAQVGVNPHTYASWRKKSGGKPAPQASSPKKTIGPAGKKPSLLNVLREMADNREKRQELEQAEKQIQELDTRYETLRKQLNA